MIFKAIVEYEYPVEHKPPVKAEIVLHGDRVITDNIKWLKELKENNDALEQIRAEIEEERDKVYQNRQGCDTYYADGLDTALEIIDKYRG